MATDTVEGKSANGNGVPPGGLKLKEACQYLGGISPISVRRLVQRKLLKPNRALRHLVFSRAELDRFLNS